MQLLQGFDELYVHISCTGGSVGMRAIMSLCNASQQPTSSLTHSALSQSQLFTILILPVTALACFPYCYIFWPRFLIHTCFYAGFVFEHEKRGWELRYR